MMRAFRLPILTLALLVGACGGSDGPTAPGTTAAAFHATISGDVSTTVDGTSAFGIATDPQNGDAFAVQMNETGGTGLIGFIRPVPQQPAAGTYSFVDATGNAQPGANEFVGVLQDGPGNAPTAQFLVTSGTLTVSKSTPQLVEGSFQVDAIGIQMDDPNTQLSIAVSGTFSARPGAVGGSAQVTSARVERRS